jgi:hypothetical protein
MRWLIAFALVAGTASGFACGHSPGTLAMDPQRSPSAQNRVAGEYLVTLAPGADVKVINDLYGRFEIKRIQDLGRSVFLLVITDDPGPAKMDEIRRQEARIKAVQPNFAYRSNN